MICLNLETNIFQAKIDEIFNREPLEETEDGPVTTYRFFGEDAVVTFDSEQKHLVILGKDTLDLRYEFDPEKIIKHIVTKVVHDGFVALGMPADIKLNTWSFTDYHGTLRYRRRLSLGSAKWKSYLDWYTRSQTSKLFEKIETKLTLGHHNFAMANDAGIKEVQEKAPALLAFLGEYCSWRREQFKLMSETDPNVKPTDWSRPHNVFAEMRQFMVKRYGLTKGGWKVLLSLNNEQKGRWLLNDALPLGFATVLEVINQHPKNRFPKVTGMRAVHELTRLFPDRINAPEHNLLKQLVGEALTHSTKAKHIANWVSLEWDQVKDWYSAAGRNLTPDANQLKAKWTWFVRNSEAWHEEIQHQQTLRRMEARKEELVTWESALEAHTHKDFEFVPLLSSADLYTEGKEQVHCVGGTGYISRCKNGKSMIWSIRNDQGARVATLEINQDEHNEDRYYRGQLKGKRNTEVTPEVEKAADGLVKRYNDAIKAFRKKQADEKKAREEAIRLAEEIRQAAVDQALFKKLKAKLAKRMERQDKGLPVTIPQEEAELLKKLGIEHDLQVA